MNHHGFKNTTIQTQESFLLNHANQRIQEIFANRKTGMNKEMQALGELIHPAHLGHGMQALWGTRLPETTKAERKELSWNYRRDFLPHIVPVSDLPPRPNQK